MNNLMRFLVPRNDKLYVFFIPVNLNFKWYKSIQDISDLDIGTKLNISMITPSNHYLIPIQSVFLHK
ncbi:hypothetical protein FI146_450058 [Flavobacterium psychrophilum]|nr:hypothetical protein FI146_450058 [Flavobacterium psychrophilum]